jgi:tartrate dehydrogenase/decarboxylase/D-malate dehydrogenase
MLDHLGLTSEAAAVMSAIETTTASGVLTPDLGGSATTRGVTDAILARL